MIRWFNNLLWQSSWYATKNIFRSWQNSFLWEEIVFWFPWKPLRSQPIRCRKIWNLAPLTVVLLFPLPLLEIKPRLSIAGIKHRSTKRSLLPHCSIHSSEILSWHNLQRIFMLTQKLASQTNIFINIEFTKRILFAITLVSLPLAELGGMF